MRAFFYRIPLFSTEGYFYNIHISQGGLVVYFRIGIFRASLLLAGIICSFVVGRVLVGRIELPQASAEQAGNMDYIQVESLPAAKIVLPYKMWDLDVVLEAVCEYDGPFQEDGSNEEVFATGALIVKNESDVTLRRVSIFLTRGAKEYCFQIEMLPSGCRVLVPERDRQSIFCQNFEECIGFAEACPPPVSDVVIRYEELSRIYVSNISNEDLYDLTLIHRTYLQDAELYIGGKAFYTEVGKLEAGETVLIEPDYYITSNSKVLGAYILQ